MVIKEEAKCRCEEPDTTETYVAGAQMCRKCKKVANWRSFEDTAQDLAAPVRAPNQMP